jgi:hypothetical protein
LPTRCCRLRPSRFFGGKVTRTDRSKVFGWRCQVCSKSLTAKPVAGKVIMHTASNGSLCPGSGKAAANPASRRKPRKSQVARGKDVIPTDTSKSSSRSQTQKSVAAKRERPEMLPAKKATGVYPDPQSRMKGGNHWTFFQDNPRQDMESDAGWRRVRLGTSQGTGKRR